MNKKRPCLICRLWFVPNRRAGNRQRVCSKDACQRERHLRSCAEWHGRERMAELDGRVEARILLAPAEPAGAFEGPSARQVSGLAWDAVRDAVGEQACAVIRVLLKHALDQARDAVRREALVLHKEFARHPLGPPRDAIARPPPGG